MGTSQNLPRCPEFGHLAVATNSFGSYADFWLTIERSPTARSISGLRIPTPAITIALTRGDQPRNVQSAADLA